MWKVSESYRSGSQTKYEEYIKQGLDPAEWEVQQHCCFLSSDEGMCSGFKEMKFTLWQPVW